MKVKSLKQALKNKLEVTHLQLNHEELTEVPLEILELKQLRILSLECNQLTTLPNWLAETEITEISVHNNQITSFGKLPITLKKLNLNANQLESLPEELAQCNALSSLYVSQNKLIKTPQVLSKLSALTECYLQTNLLEEFPIELENLPVLQKFLIGNNQIKSIPSITGFQRLKELSISRNSLTSIDTSLAQLSSLTKLDISYNHLSELPSLSQIKQLNFSNNQFAQLPSFLVEVPKSHQLEHINISDNPFKEFPFEVLFWKDHFPRVLADGVFDRELLWDRSKFINLCTKQSQDFETQKHFYAIATQQEKTLATIPLKHFFQALQINFPSLQRKALTWIVKHWEENLKNSPLQKDSQLVILGKVNLNRTEVKQRLKKSGVKYATKITEKTTHVVIQKGAKNYDGVDRENLVLLPENALQNYLDTIDPLYLHQNDTPQEDHENLHSLLFSVESEMVNLGLEMLKSLGVPKDIVTELFLIMKNTRLANKVRNKAKKYLLLNCSEQLKKNLEKHSFYYQVVSKENHFGHFGVELMTKGTEIDFEKLARYVTIHTQKHHQELAIYLTDRAENVQHLKNYLLEHQDILTNPQGNRHWTLQTKYFQHPTDLFKIDKSLILSLQISSPSDFEAIQENLHQLTALEILWIDNVEMKQLPPSFEKLTNLQRVSISRNLLMEFPIVLEEMNILKQIHLSDNPFVKDENQIPNKKIFKLNQYPSSITRK